MPRWSRPCWPDCPCGCRRNRFAAGLSLTPPCGIRWAMGQGKYRIGQAADELGLRPSVLRYWESEFPQLEPVRTAKGQRLYTEEHLALLKTIRRLLHDEGLTIEGARRRLEEDRTGECMSELRREVRDELKAIRGLLSKGGEADGPGPGDDAEVPADEGRDGH